jgi:Domain of unknown function (DUF222)/HNH endonuclease
MDLVDELVGVIERFKAADAFAYCDPASIVALCGAAARFDYAQGQALVAFAEEGEWRLDGAQSAAAWIAAQCHLPLGEVRRQLRRGRALGQMPVVAQAFGDGVISAAHVDQLVKAHKMTETLDTALGRAGGPGAEPGAFARCEASLVEAATTLGFGSFCAAVAYFAQMADPEGADERDRARLARRDVSLCPSVDGMYLGHMALDPFGGATVDHELTRLNDELFEADWAEAKAGLGRDPKAHELCRTPAQRRADALVEMALRSRGAISSERRPEPSFSIMVGYETLYGRICRIEGGPIVAPGSLVPLLEGATFERIVFSPGTRIECSATSRFFTGATRRAIALRDQLCSDPFCERPAEQCQIDHIVPFAQGGQTTQENGRVLCGFHNRLRNHGPPGKRGDRELGEGESGERAKEWPEDQGGP